MIENMKTLPERLKHARELREWTQSHLATVADVSTGTIGNIEAGLRQSKGSLPQIAEALRVSYKWLSKGEGEMELPQPQLDLIGQEFFSLRTMYERVPMESRTRAMLDAIRAIASYVPKSTQPTEALSLSHQAETAPEARLALPDGGRRP